VPPVPASFVRRRDRVGPKQICLGLGAIQFRGGNTCDTRFGFSHSVCCLLPVAASRISKVRAARPLLPLSRSLLPPCPSPSRPLSPCIVTGTYSDGSTKDLTSSVTWSSSDPNAASVSASGLATGVATGVVTVTARSGSLSGSATVTVNSAGTNLTSIVLSPTNPSIPINTTQQLTATGTYGDGSSRDLTAVVTWSSSTIANATVDVTGLVKGIAAGSATITATLGSVSQSSSVTITAPSITSISVTPEDVTLAIGIGQQFTASAIYSDGSIQDLVSGVTWASSTTSVATIDNNGLASILAAGTTTITATVGSFTDSTTITVVPAHLTSITLSPATVSMAAGTQQQFTATGNFDDGSTQVLTSGQWSSSALSVLSVDANGLGVAVGPGTTTVTVTSGTISDTASVTVTNAMLVSLAIAPLNSSMPAGAIKQFAATGTFSDNSTQDMTKSVLWSSSNPVVASINDVGTVTSFTAGSTTIVAAWGAITQSTTLTVSNVTLVSITISPANPRVEAHTSLKFTATGVYSDGSTAALTNVSWRSTKPQFANMRSSGILHAKRAGTLTVSAVASGVTGTTTVVVGTGTLVSVAITPADSSVTVGATQQFTATGTFSDGTTQDVTINAHWSSTVPTVATIANAPVRAGLATTFASGTTTIGVNHSGITATTNLSAN
jgi:trimeric autotransporter adhesin